MNHTSSYVHKPDPFWKLHIKISFEAFDIRHSFRSMCLWNWQSNMYIRSKRKFGISSTFMYIWTIWCCLYLRRSFVCRIRYIYFMLSFSSRYSWPLYWGLSTAPLYPFYTAFYSHPTLKSELPFQIKIFIK